MTAHVRIPVETAVQPRALLSALVQCAFVAAACLYLYGLCWEIVPPDMGIFLFPWYEHIVEHGPLGAFAAPFSNYTPPYLYLLALGSLADGLLQPLSIIKLLSVAGSGFLALAVSQLLKALRSDPKPAMLVFLLPSVVLNSALLGQCDALWAGACVLAVAAMIQGRTVACLVWCGVAISFKAQSAFIAPFVIGALIGHRAPLWQWTIPPLVYAGAMLPAWVLGWPAVDLATVYVVQAAWSDTPGNLANPWAWASVFAPDPAQDFYALGYAAGAAASVAIGILAAHSSRNARALLVLALLAAVAIPFLLPKMHERYYFLADVLALALALSSPERRVLVTAAIVQLASLGALFAYIYNWPVPMLAGSALAALGLAGLTGLFHDFAARHYEDNLLEDPNIAKRIA